MLMMISILKSTDTAPYDVFNVATEDYVSVRQIAQAVANLISPEALLEFGTEPRGWKGEVPVVRFDTTKIKNLNWKAERNSISAIHASIRSMAQELNINPIDEEA
jgi:UDP-glucose 4-epimerase